MGAAFLVGLERRNVLAISWESTWLTPAFLSFLIQIPTQDQGFQSVGLNIEVYFLFFPLLHIFPKENSLDGSA